MAESSKQPDESKVSVDLEKSPAASSPQSRSGAGAMTRFDEFERDMERMFDTFMSRNWMRPFREFPGFRDLPTLRGGVDLPRLPKMDLVERDDEIVVRAELPGVDKNDLHVSMAERTLTIRASTRKEQKEEKGEYYRREISTGEVSRTVTLPCEVDGQNTKAEFKDGMLEIVAPKVAKAKRVDVQVK